MPSTYLLPSTYPAYGYQEDPLLALWFPHLRALRLCPPRSLFRGVGSSSRMEGDSTSLLSITALNKRLRVAPGRVEETPKVPNLR